ncbi:hypothetical protein APY04_3162 [Hyphomicrobium sulfonivorans]|uniref:Uncharacterized protein n=1 Tax=Hyphomicrobium sulfonivorans TaxID=121290 RepID=A0A120CTH9_HYPSL|nr:hypothetical protein APY04_3162 [Hyphomicrobium sulfonivorans]
MRDLNVFEQFRTRIQQSPPLRNHAAMIAIAPYHHRARDTCDQERAKQRATLFSIVFNVMPASRCCAEGYRAR